MRDKQSKRKEKRSGNIDEYLFFAKCIRLINFIQSLLIIKMRVALLGLPSQICNILVPKFI